ncbi:NAD(P)H dehydrogenase (quinone) [Fulvivirga imtechensis AK7]|uniref:NAD(P)H dehydrogenase (Quinone) n=1 Tax=Fulvivirga imtechensis AK7 TaxID=1237149 RepID=L8JYM6_9BACT|nr:NAD(P)H-dependent oxidoreductase [Fulvivirga imtechensis]ELR72297.1 NAD(P)H dehydrogenase (quinone) [Fulvivirga imtechensis AK7]
MNVLVIEGHPRKNSFSGALAQSYKAGAKQAQANVMSYVLADKTFNLHVTTPSPHHQFIEKDVKEAQELIAWADHLVFVYPTWWGTMPALLKGFLDRVFTPGFAFTESEDTNVWGKLLKGKSAQLITTMDTPKWVYQWIYKSPGHRALKQATLQFCGVNPVRILTFSPIKTSNKSQRAQYLEKAFHAGLKLKHGVLSQWGKVRDKIATWLKALRLQFYPMTLVAYATGALGAIHLGHSYNSLIFWIGFFWIFLVEAATVLTNDYYDYRSDKQNKFHSPFTGGSRVLVEKELTFKENRSASLATLILSIVLAGLLFMETTISGKSAALMAVPYLLALGYTAPPLKLSYHGWGELDVGITHSILVVLCGYVFQGGNVLDPFPWLLSIPLFLAILPSIILAGIPDYEADKAVSKKTIAVKIGRKNAAKVALTFVVFATVAGIAWHVFDLLPGAYSLAIFMIVPHALIIVYLLLRYIKNPSPPPRINSLMIATLSYILWFGLIPLFNLL